MIETLVNKILVYFWNRTLSTLGPFDWMDMTCCLERQLCEDRNNWIHVKNSSVPIVNLFGLQVPLGNTGNKFFLLTHDLKWLTLHEKFRLPSRNIQDLST